MKCSRCGFDDPAAREYCPNCGARIDLSSREHVMALVRQKKAEREQAVFKTLSRWLAGAVLLLIVLFALRSAFSLISHEPVEAYFPPPRVNITFSHKLSVKPARLRMPDRKVYGYGTSNKKEDTVIKQLVAEALREAPRYRVGGPGGKIIRAFVLKRYGDAVTIFTQEGEQIVPAAKLTALD